MPVRLRLCASTRSSSCAGQLLQPRLPVRTAGRACDYRVVLGLTIGGALVEARERQVRSETDQSDRGRDGVRGGTIVTSAST